MSGSRAAWTQAIAGATRAQERRTLPGRSKYHAVRCEAYGRVWDSKRELAHYERLLNIGHGGYLRNLELQPRFPLVVGGARVGSYRPDFRLEEWCDGPACCGLDICPGGHWIDVVIEVKGFRSEAYLLRRKLFQACYPSIVFREVR